MDDEYEDEDQWEDGAEDILEKGVCGTCLQDHVGRGLRLGGCLLSPSPPIPATTPTLTLHLLLSVLARETAPLPFSF